MAEPTPSRCTCHLCNQTSASWHHLGITEICLWRFFFWITALMNGFSGDRSFVGSSRVKEKCSRMPHEVGAEDGTALLQNFWARRAGPCVGNRRKPEEFLSWLKDWHKYVPSRQGLIGWISHKYGWNFTSQPVLSIPRLHRMFTLLAFIYVIPASGIVNSILFCIIILWRFFPLDMYLLFCLKIIFVLPSLFSIF